MLISYLGSSSIKSSIQLADFSNIVITGFNTDIDYEGVTYHVQTEDKGLATPLILSLVYDRGTILASKRSPYDDLLIGDFDEKILIERLQKQHKLMCAAVRAGRLEDLKRMTMKESALRQKNLIAQKEVESKDEIVEKTALKSEEILLPEVLESKSRTAGKFETADDEYVGSVPLQIVEKSVAKSNKSVEEEMLLPAEAVEIIADFVNAELADGRKLKIELLNETAFKGGERKTITMLLQRGSSKTGLSGAQVLVKIIGSSFRPLIFHAKTDSNGVATVHLQLPHFKTGRAAMLIKAISEGEEVELRRVILQG